MTRAEQFAQNREKNKVYGKSNPTRSEMFHINREQNRLLDEVQNTDFSKMYSALQKGGYISNDLLTQYQSDVQSYMDKLSKLKTIDEDKKKQSIKSAKNLSKAIGAYSDYMKSFKDKDDYNSKVESAKNLGYANLEEQGAYYDEHPLLYTFNGGKKYEGAMAKGAPDANDLLLLEAILAKRSGKTLSEDQEKSLREAIDGVPTKSALSDYDKWKLENYVKRGVLPNPIMPANQSQTQTPKFYDPIAAKKEGEIYRQKQNEKKLDEIRNGRSFDEVINDSDYLEALRESVLVKYLDSDYARVLRAYSDADFNTYANSPDNDRSDIEKYTSYSDDVKRSEKEMYFYLKGKYGDRAAVDYLKEIEPELAARAGQDLYEDNDGWLFRATLPIRAGLENAFSGTDVGVTDVLGGYFKKNLNLNSPTRYTTSALQVANYLQSEDTDKGNFKVFGHTPLNWANTAAYTVSNMLPSMAVAVATQGLGLAAGIPAATAAKYASAAASSLMGVQAAGNEYANMINNGMNEDQARSIATVKGVWEGWSEYALGGFEGMLGNRLSQKLYETGLENAGRGMVRALVNVFEKTKLSEGLEEVVQNIGESIIDGVTTGEWEWSSVEDLAYEFTMGVLAANIMGAPGAVSNTVYKYSPLGKNAEYSALLGDNIEAQKSMVAEALETEEGTKSNKLGKKYNAILENGGELSGNQLRKLDTSTAKSQVNADVDTISTEVEQYLTNLGETGNVKLKSLAIAKSIADKRLTKAEKNAIESSKYADRVLNEMNPENIFSQKYNDILSRKINTKKVNALAYGENGKIVKELIKESDGTQAEAPKKAIKISETGKSVDITTGEEIKLDTSSPIASIKDGKVMLKTETGKTVDLNDVDFANEAEAELYTAISSADVNTEAANKFIAEYTPDMSPDNYILGMLEGHTYGRTGYPLAAAKGAFFKNLSPVQQNTAYSLGRIFSEKQTQAEQKAVNQAVKAGKKAGVKNKGRVVFEGSASAENLTERQSESIKIIGRLASDITHNTVHFYTSKVNEKGVRVFADDVSIYKKGTKAPNGFFDPDTGDVWIDINAGNNGEGVILWTAAHEFTHLMRKNSPAMFKRLSDFLMENYGNLVIEGKADATIEDLIDARLASVKENNPNKSASEQYDIAHEEVVADMMQTMFTDTNALEVIGNLKKKDFKLWQKLRDFFKSLQAKIKALYSDVSSTDPAVNSIKQMEDAIDKIVNMFAEGLVDAGNVQERVITSAVGVHIDTNTESVNPLLMSERTWNASDYVQNRNDVAKEMADKLGISVSKAKAYIDSINSIAKIIANDRVRLDYEASEGVSSFVGNSEYGGSIDFSTICKKRRLLTGTFTAIQEALPNTALTADEILTIRKMMKDRGYEVSCGLCYVEGSRAKMGEYARDFLAEYKKTNPEYLPNMAEINTPEGLEKVRKEHPDTYDAYVKYMNGLAQRKPKLYQMATEYNGEILNKFKKSDNVDEKNRNGGLRMQSFSDFEIIHLIDCMQAIMDMSRVGLAGQAYTKVPDFAAALGNTGLKINLSLIAKGVDKNGHIILDEVEGMKKSDAKALRDMYSDNVGTILVVFNDEQLYAAMNDDFIDFIIPFHRSQWNKAQYELMGLPEGAKDYTQWQNESYMNPVYNKNGKRMRPDNYMPNRYWDFSVSGKENAKAYLEMCALNNRVPKFSFLLNNNGDGSYSLKNDGSTDGYWKLLIDFKMYNNEGVGVPQETVKPDFNMDEATRMLDKYEGGHRSFPVAQDVVDDFTKEYLHNAKFSDRDTEYLELTKEPEKNETRLREMVEEAAVNWGAIEKSGKPEVFFHGTDNDFYSFMYKSGEMGKNGAWHGYGFYFTDDSKYAENYGNRTIEAYLNANRIVDEKSKTISKDEWKSFLEAAKKAQANSDLVWSGNRIDVDYELRNDYEDADNDVDLINFFVRTHAAENTDVIAKDLEVLKKSIGVDGIRTDEGIFVVFNPEQIKSADLVTYDDNGNIILLSKRFNKENKDIRFSERDSAAMTEERIDYLIQDSGAGARTDYAQAWITSINPTDFINLTTKNIQNREVFDKIPGDYGSTVDEYDYIEGLKKETRQTPYLAINYETNQVVGHEGRHRMRALEKDGITSADIKIEFRDNDGSVIKELNGYGNPLNIIDFLEIFNERGTKQSAVISNIIPLNEANRGNIVESYGDEDARIRFSERDQDATDPRSLLSRALESAATNDIELKNLKAYQEKIGEYNKLQNKLVDLRAEIKEISFSKGKRDTARLNALREEATKTANRINDYDKRLLIEAAKPLQNVIATEKTKAEKRVAERMRTMQAERRESHNASVTRGKIKRLYAKIEKMWRNPTDSSYIPANLRDSVLEVLASVDIRTGKTNKTQEALTKAYNEYQKLLKNQDIELQGAYDPDMAEALFTLYGMLGERNIYDKDLTANTLNDIYTVMKSIYGQIMDAKYLIGEAEKMTIRESGNKIIDEQDAIYDNRSDSKTKNILKAVDDKTSFFYLNSLRAILKMSNFNSDAELNRLFVALNNGLKKKYDFKMLTSKKLDALVKTKEGQKAFDSAIKDVLDFGWGKMTKMQAAQLMLSLERESKSGTKHIATGGATITDPKYHDNVEKRRDNAKRIQYDTLQMMSDIREALEKDEWMQKYIEVAKEILRVDSKNAINSASQILKHRDIASDDYYIPFVTDDSFTVKEIEGLKHDMTIEGMGSLKSLVLGAGNALYIEGLDIVLNRAIDNAANYYGLSVPIRNINRSLNVKNDENGRSVKDSIKKNWKADGLKLIEQTLTDIQTNRKNDRIAILDTLKSAFITSVLNGNISVAIKQAASLDTAFAVLNYRPSAVAWLEFAKTVKNFKSITEEIDEHTSEHWRRRIGLTTDEIATMAQNSGFFGRVNRKLPAAINGNKWIQMIDCWTTATFWNMAKQDINSAIKKGKYDFEVGSDEYWNAVTALYEETVETTQPMYDALHRSEMQKNAVSNKVFMFKTQPLQNAGLLYESVHSMLAAKASGDTKLAKARAIKLGKVLYSQTRSAITFALMTMLASAIKGKMKRYKDDDDELTIASLVKRMGLDIGGTGTGLVLPIGGSEIYNYLEAVISGDSYSKALLSHPTVDFLNEYPSALTKVFSEPSVKNISRLLVKFGDLTGQPASNYYNLIHGIGYNAKDIADGKFLEFEASEEQSTAHRLNKAYGEYKKGNVENTKEYIDAIINEKMAEGKTEKEAKGSVKASLTRRFKDQYIDAFSANDTDTMLDIRKYLLATGVYGTKSDVTETCQKWIKDSKQ